MTGSVFCSKHRAEFKPPAQQKYRGDCEADGCFVRANTAQGGRWLCDDHVDLVALFRDTVARGREPSDAFGFLKENS